MNDHLKSILIGNEVKSQREPGHETDAQSMGKKKLSSLGVFSPIDLNGYLITHDPQPASRADMASEGLPRLHAP
ncbi:hypothetical protein ACV1C5_19575, partial [Aeromonas caviae]